VKIVPWVLLLALGGLAYWQNCYDVKLVEEGKKLDSTYVADTTRLTNVRRLTDSLLRDTTAKTMPTEKAKKIVADERGVCDAVVETCEKRVENLKKQLRPPRLLVFGEGNYRTPSFGKPLLEGTASVRGGLSFGVDRNTFIEGYVDQPLVGDGELTLNVRVRKQWRLF
jgi:hypothetical protein